MSEPTFNKTHDVSQDIQIELNEERTLITITSGSKNVLLNFHEAKTLYLWLVKGLP